MKRLFFTLIVAAAAIVSTSAQTTERLTHTQVWNYDIPKLDAMYKVWNERVQASPQDEQAWRNLFEIYEARKSITPVTRDTLKATNGEVFIPANTKEQEAYKKACNIMPRMEQAIPDSYTFNYCAYESDYEYDKYRGEIYEMWQYQQFRNQFADRAIELLPEDAQADDYERWASYLYLYMDTVRLKDVLTRYYESGLYPAVALQYHFNELAGMDENAVYMGWYEGDIIGKLIIQYVLHERPDVTLYCENSAHWRPYLEALFRQIGLSETFFDPDGTWANENDQIDELRYIARYICEHSTRPVYCSASSLSMFILGTGLPDDIKACLYNEGLTMRYSAKPYDNQAVKRRNVEERYLMEYLLMSFSPWADKVNTQRFQTHPDVLAFNYLLLLNDLLPYYKKHNPQRHAWLNRIFTRVLSQMVAKGTGGYGFAGKMFYIKESTEGGFHYEVTEEPYNFADKNDDEATKQRKREEQQRATRVIIKTEPVK